MPDAPAVAAPVAPTAPAPAPAAATPPPGSATPTPAAPAKPHHSATQPRTEAGTFDKTLPGKIQQAEAFLDIDGKRLPMSEVKTLLAERQEDARSARADREELARLRQESQRWQRPHEALSPEVRREIARRELEDFARQQEEAKLPPEQRALLQQRRELERQRAEFHRMLEEREAQEQQTVVQQQRAQATANVRAAMKALGAEETDEFALRAIVDEFWRTSQHGKNYSPEVIAARVRRQLDGVATSRAAQLGPKALLANQGFVAALNSLDDPEVLRALMPLYERMRTLNLQQRGIAQPVATTATPTNVVPLPSGQRPRTDSEWITYFRSNGAPQPDDASAHAKYWALKDRGVL